MEISNGIEIIHTALWLSQEKTLIINDLHLGYEEALQRKGILVPKFQLPEIIKEMKLILEKVAPSENTPEKASSLTIIINGDLKHEFGTVLKQEWKEVLEFLDFVGGFCKNIVIIRGNHDPLLRFITEKRGVQVVTEYSVGDTLIVHGDVLVKINKKGIKRIIIGHEHPAITLKKGSKREKYKCFLRGKWKEAGKGLGELVEGVVGREKWKEVIAVPSFNPLLEGTDVLKEKMLSPYLEKVADFEVYVVGKGEVYRFGKVGEMVKRS